MASMRSKRQKPAIEVEVDWQGGHTFVVDSSDYIGSGEELARDLLRGGMPEKLDDGTVRIWPAHRVRKVTVRPITSAHHATGVSERSYGQK